MTRAKQIVLATLATVATGCGSTVSYVGTSSSGFTAPAAGQPRAEAGSPAHPTGTAADASAAVPRGGGADAGTAAQVVHGESGIAGTANRSWGPGVTAHTVAVGCPYYPQANSQAVSLGGTFDTGNEVAQWKAVLADINRRGGVGGRQLVCVFHAYTSTSSAESADQEQQAACADWTQDHHVLAFLDHPFDELLAQCAKDASAVVVSDVGSLPASTFHRYPNLIADGVNMDRAGANEVQVLAARHFLAPNNRIGVIYPTDIPGSGQALSRMTSVARANGVRIVDTVGYSAFNLESGAAAASSAVLKFASDGVDRVLFIDYAGGLAFSFMNAAQSQHYQPRYGLTSNSTPGALTDLGLVPPSQMQGAQGVGWLPIYDLSYAADPDSTATPGRQRCLAIMKRAGLSWSSSSTEYLMTAKCDKAWTFTAALNTAAAGNAGLNATGLLRGAEQLANVESALTFRLSFTGQQQDGATLARTFAFLADCSCLRYVTPTYTLH